MQQATKIESRFFADLLANNSDYLDGFKRWIFHPGMLFNSLDKWWGDKKQRTTAHEGIDLCYFEDSLRRVKKVDQYLRIPATFAGTIIKVDNDFLGKSIYLKHEISSESGAQLYTVYGHLKPCRAVEAGRTVQQGEIIAVISDPAGNGVQILPHLHLSFAWIPDPMPPDRLTWKNHSTDRRIRLIDPLSILSK
jgi:hypothetical protein